MPLETQDMSDVDADAINHLNPNVSLQPVLLFQSAAGPSFVMNTLSKMCADAIRHPRSIASLQSLLLLHPLCDMAAEKTPRTADSGASKHDY